MVGKLAREVRLCPHSKGLRCYLIKQSCPLQDPLFTRDLEFFLFKNRTPRSVVWNPAQRTVFGRDLTFSHFLKAMNAIIFGDEFIFEYVDFKKTGKIDVSKEKCRQWMGARAKWKVLLKGQET